MFDELVSRIAPRFFRVEVRRRATGFLQGLLAQLPVKNAWTIAEHAGDRSPDGMQRLLRTAVWDHEGVREDLRDYVTEHLGHPDAVLVFDETGDQKKGNKTVGVQRQYSGTCGRIENCQVAVYASYVSGLGHTMIDVELYMPKVWTDNPDRLAEAEAPQGLEFATKPALARRILARAIDAGPPFSWVAADEVYGGDSALRHQLEQHQIGYVLAVACDHRIPTPRGLVPAAELAKGLPRKAWQTYSAGNGSKGRREYEWALVSASPGHHGLLIRRNRKTKELAYYRCWAPRHVSLAHLVKIAGSRWPIETDFQTSKGQTGLDEHQVRHWTSWHRWVILVMLAHAFLAVTAALERLRANETDELEDLIPLTIPEITRLIRTWIDSPARPITHQLRWSHWRRRRQAQAKRSHYRRREHSHA